MSSVSRSHDAVAGVPGVRFKTDARQGTTEEKALQRIQYTLSGGQDVLPARTTVPHLALLNTKAVGGQSSAVISLWVPQEQETQAAALLREEGFDVD